VLVHFMEEMSPEYEMRSEYEMRPEEIVRLFDYNPNDSKLYLLESMRIMSELMYSDNADDPNKVFVKAVKALRESRGLGLYEAKRIMDLVRDIYVAAKEGRFIGQVKGGRVPLI
jgi:hypothetical protein